jgi:hypothetical protein
MKMATGSKKNFDKKNAKVILGESLWHFLHSTIIFILSCIENLHFDKF